MRRDAFLEPLPLREGAHRQGKLTYRMERLDTGTWRMHQVLVAQHHRDDHELALRARTITRAGPHGADRRTLSTPDEFAEALTEFRIPLDDIEPEQLTALWEKTAHRHEAWPAIQARAVRTRARGATPAGQWRRTCHSTARDH